jgi:NAD+ diphosphatase
MSASLIFDRLHHKRNDTAHFEQVLRSENTRIVAVADGKNLFMTTNPILPCYLPPVQLDKLSAFRPELALLGADNDGNHYVGAAFGKDALEAIATQGTVALLREKISALSPLDASILSYARALAHWHGVSRYCGICGNLTQAEQGGTVRRCTNQDCAIEHFPRTDPAIIAIISYQQECLLAHHPGWADTLYSTIAGFVEPGESLEEAVKRESLEEVGCRIEQLSYLRSQPWPYPCSLMIGFEATAASPTIEVDGVEIDDARWFSRNAIEQGLMQGTLRIPSPASISFALIEKWFEQERPKGTLRELVKATSPQQ